MRRRTGILIGTAVTVTVVAAGAGAAVGLSAENERPITGPALDTATAAALEHTGGGRVTETEAGDEEGAYEVEVTLPDGRQVDVHLDEHFAVLDATADGDGKGDDGKGDDGKGDDGKGDSEGR
jgi:hypothetical protein